MHESYVGLRVVFDVGGSRGDCRGLDNDSIMLRSMYTLYHDYTRNQGTVGKDLRFREAATLHNPHKLPVNDQLPLSFPFSFPCDFSTNATV